jgi:hypothetical protein
MKTRAIGSSLITLSNVTGSVKVGAESQADCCHDWRPTSRLTEILTNVVSSGSDCCTRSGGRYNNCGPQWPGSESQLLRAPTPSPGGLRGRNTPEEWGHSLESGGPHGRTIRPKARGARHDPATRRASANPAGGLRGGTSPGRVSSWASSPGRSRRAPSRMFELVGVCRGHRLPRGGD